MTRREDVKDHRRTSGKETGKAKGMSGGRSGGRRHNLEITRPNDKKTEKKLRTGRPVLLEEGNTSCGGSGAQKDEEETGTGERNRPDESAGGTKQGVKIRALRERLIKGCKLTGANDVAVAPLETSGLSVVLDQPPCCYLR